jgi:transcriptional regulator with XRE-family HTH domain
MASRAVLARNLRRLREARGLSQEALADLAGIDRTYVSSLERQRYSASVDMLDRLAAALEVPVADLLGCDS